MKKLKDDNHYLYGINKIESLMQDLIDDTIIEYCGLDSTKYFNKYNSFLNQP